MKDRLIALRSRSGLTALQLADRLTITEANYSRFETGERMPTAWMLRLMARALDVDVQELING